MTKEKFPWGHITERYVIGPYEIAEYVSKDDQKTYYHVWVDGKDTNESTYTLEQAMVLAVAVKTMGQHPRGLDMIFPKHSMRAILSNSDHRVGSLSPSSRIGLAVETSFSSASP